MNKIIKSTMIAGVLALAAGQAFATDAPTPAKVPAGTGSALAQDMRHERNEYWKSMDANSDGAIGKDEFMASAEKHFKDMDTNNDGKISRDELQAHRQKMREHYSEMRQQRMQKMMQRRQMMQNQAAPAAPAASPAGAK